MEARRHGWLAGAVAALALGAFAPAAGAATASITDDGTTQVLHYTAAPGEANNLLIEGGPDYQVAELQPTGGGTPVHIVGDASCPAYPIPDPPGSDGVSCHVVAGIDRVEVDLGDGNDQIEIMSADAPVIVNGGDGDDLFDDTEQTNLPGPFARTFDGGPGADYFRAGLQTGMPSEYIGGAGTDIADYNYRTGAQAISLDNVANDGATAEGDNVHNDIEYVFGGKGADTITGTENADYIMGFGGADTINGLGGGDTLVADTTAATDCSADALDGAGGEDTLWLGGHTTANAGAGNDRIVAGGIDCAGAGDVVHGGDDLDQADFGLVTAPGLTVSLDGGVLPNDGFGGADNYDADVEDLFAGDHGMTLIGNEKANHLVGGAGNDLLDGGLGADQLDGGGGIDTADYSKRALPLTLTIGVGNDDGETGEGDSISADVENLRGGLGSDVLTGNVLDNVLDGGPGADNISGGDGIDAVDYTRRAAAVNVTLNAGAGNDGEAGENDTIASDVEGAFGGAGNDKLVGAVGNGFLFGFAGNDDLSDVGGADTLDAGTGDDVINSVDGAVDHDVCGPGIDKATADPTDTVDADCTDTTSPPPGPPTPPSPPSPPSQPGPPGPPAPPVVPIDHTAPNATLALGTSKLGKLLSGGLKLSVRPSETGTVRAVLTAESTTARALQRRGVKGVLASGQANATGGATKTLTLRLGRKARRALSGSAVAKFKLLVTVTDAAGNKRTLTKHLKIKG